MRSVKSTILEKLNAMRWKSAIILGLIFFLSFKSFSQQENSPYSRYGLGDKMPTTNVMSRGMGGVSAAYRDSAGFTINYNNPATYSAFYSWTEGNSKKSVAGRAIVDVGINYNVHGIREPNSTDIYTSSNLYFSHLGVGIPLRRNWGMSFGLRQLSRIDYKINRFERLYDPNTGEPIDSSLTEFTGDGGSYAVSLGTGIKIKNLSVGLDLEYVFGKTEFVTKRALINDTVAYASANFTTNTGFGGLVLTGGLQYEIKFNSSLLRLGGYGNLKHNLDANADRLRETFTRTSGGDLRVDSVFQVRDVKGEIVYPGSYTVGFLYAKGIDFDKKIYRSWSLGVDYSVSQWDQYRFYGKQDSVTNSSIVSVGGEFRPDFSKKGYFNQIAYRLGFNFGKDYIRVGNDLPIYGLTFGLGLPLRRWSTFSRQETIINLAFEYSKRGNNDNIVKDNIFRISAGFSLSDVWFQKKKYE
jgi:hypothetical protein